MAKLAKKKKATPRPIRFRSVLNEDEERGPFKVFLIHGHSDDWMVVRDFITAQLRFDVVVSVEDFRGAPIMEKIRKTIWHECDCAVAILSEDCQQSDGTTSASPNVLLEVGYCMGFFDYRYWEDTDIEPVLLIRQGDTAIPSDLQGFEYIPYSREGVRGIRECFPILREGLERLYEQVKAYFDEDDEEEE